MSIQSLKQLCASIRLHGYVVGYSSLAELQGNSQYRHTKLVGVLYIKKKKIAVKAVLLGGILQEENLNISLEHQMLYDAFHAREGGAFRWVLP